MAIALQNSQLPTSNSQLVDINHAGTAMRFLTAYFAIQENREVVLTGSARMKDRPIQILVEALKQLGAEITYEENDGFPPIKIKGKKLTQSKVSLPANVSSQYISALLLIAPKLENGIELTLEGKITSIPYIKMTLALLNEIGVETSFVGNTITVKPKLLTSNSQLLTVESDWSSASYFYSIIALSPIGTEITLSSYKQNSLQGDSVLAEIYKDFGVETVFQNKTILLRKIHNRQPTTDNFELNNSPDIAQTIAVTCFGLGIGCYLTGLHTLKIKETDRLEALKVELTKLGAIVSVTNDSLTIEPSSAITENVAVKTYQDHRMAMAFAPLALKTPIISEEAEVVSKSYPTFWEDLKSIGFQIEST
jgi:3-phosphoshikimate 1-carboxyvinyltransferase